MGRRRHRGPPGPAGRQRPGHRDPRAHRRHHRRRGDRDGLGLAEGLRGHGGEHIINTHTDGPNATEENGGLGLLALARYLAGLPSRNRDMYFALVTGHFQLPQFTRAVPDPKNVVVGNDAISVWMLDHPDIYRAAALGVTVEHLGATMWQDVAGQYAPTGGSDWGTTYTMQHNPLNAANAEQDAYLSAVAAVNADGWPDYPVATVRPGAIPVYLGEGAPCTPPGWAPSRCARAPPTCCRPAARSTRTCSTWTSSTST